MRIRTKRAVFCVFLVAVLLAGMLASGGGSSAVASVFGGPPAGRGDGGAAADAYPGRGGRGLSSRVESTPGDGRVSPEEREAAAERAKAAGMRLPGLKAGDFAAAQIPMPDPTATPHYFGPYPNYATSPLPVIDNSLPSPAFYFAEGTTRPGFDTYLCLQNPGGLTATVRITYMRGDATTAEQILTLDPHSRLTVSAADVLGVGDDTAHDFSAKVECTNGQQIVAERPMYFNYLGKWTGGHVSVGATTPASTIYFAEGTTRPGFDPYICIQNPGDLDADVTVTYMEGDGSLANNVLTVPAHSRATVNPRNKLGTADDPAHDFSARVECTNGQKLVAERAMYFNYLGKWNGGHVVMGASAITGTYYLAEGTTRPDFDPYLSIQNPGLNAAEVTVTYFRGDGTVDTEMVTVPKNSRATLNPRNKLGTADDSAHDFSAKVECTNGQQILVERPMYFNYRGSWTGGHDVMGFAFTTAVRVIAGTGMRKFVDSLPLVGSANANNLGQYIPVAVPDTVTYPGSDYYEIELGQYTQQLHSDLPPTTLRGYRQTNTTDPTVSVFTYTGPMIVAQRDRPVRVKFTNKLPTGEGGNLFLPVDTTVMGAGMGPDGMNMYTQNRATIHLHGGFTPWISDGTPHQWITPAGENTPYPKGVSVSYVPDMWFDAAGNPVPEGTPGASNDPGDGSMTFYYTNQQSARLMFYHDHSYGITRLNVYAGEASPYLLEDPVEQDLVARGVIPAEQIPLIIQDKTFVPDDEQLAWQDPTWDKVKWGGKGNLWMPHVYMPNQNPADPGGLNAFGRWSYGPWFWPPTKDLVHGPVPNPYYDPVNAPWEPPEIPGTPTPSMAMEAFMDTPVVNGTASPYLELEPKAYRFRVLNAANDRFFNLQLYLADPDTLTPDGRTLTEVKMVPAVPNPAYPSGWPTDGREGGVPDPATAGPSWIQIGNEGGFLPYPVVLPNLPIDWNTDPTTFNAGNVSQGTVILGPAERADVIVDFSAFAGKTLILYNDAPAAYPARDPRYDYYTGAPDLTDTGGAPTPLPGFGPNIRTVMQIRVKATNPAAPFDLQRLQAEFETTPGHTGVFAATQDPIIVPNAAYNKAYGGDFPADTYARIYDTSLTFRTLSGNMVTIPFQSKAIQDEMGEAYDKEYGRMSGFLGLELGNISPVNKGFVLYPFASPPVDITVDNVTPSEPLAGDGTQIWKITHNGVDTHTIHWHLFNVQVINRVAWDNIILPPDPNELGWKETVRVNPLEDIIVAMRPVAPDLPFELPNSVRPIDPTMPLGAVLSGGPGGYFDPQGNPVTVTNELVNYGWEYVLHCHLLGHEEMDMMHSMPFLLAPRPPSGLQAADGPGGVLLTWTDNSVAETSYVVEWAADAGGPWSLLAELPAGSVAYTDTEPFAGTRYYRVLARNSVGYVAPFPVMTADSSPSNVVSVTRP
ncbi:DUF5719 family protein [Candidatus Solincola tengchongensis]|uniref:DUF5719 family protein n=1 Tax=Candidatus Solincola tengchongensis TaxID=2900693 RepID=UPI00257F81BD|nr:DUF5719 family protein [Candidatus Solincola tengchongensis]